MKIISIVVIGSLALTMVGCHAPRSSAFSSAAPSVTRVQYVELPNDTSIETAVVSLGGWPATADTAITHKTTDPSYCVGYSKSTPVIAIVEQNGGTQVIVDPDLVKAYDAKARRATGTAESDLVSDSSAASGPSTASHGGGGDLPNCPIRLGQTKKQIDKKLGPPDTTNRNSDGSMECVYSPFDPVAFGEGEGIARVTSFIPFLGGATNNEAQKRRHHGVCYAVMYSNEVATDISISK